jgi:hypothetical protein
LVLHGPIVAKQAAYVAGACDLKQSCPGVILENLGIANIAAQGINRAVAAHVHHLKDRGAAFGGRRARFGESGECARYRILVFIRTAKGSVASQLIDLGDDAMLFGERWKGKGS